MLKTKEYTALRNSIEQTADSFFKTSEVRRALLEKDPEEQEYLEALQEYIDETESKKDDNNKKLEEVQNLKNVLTIIKIQFIISLAFSNATKNNMNHLGH